MQADAGRVESLKLADGRTLIADYFVDATGDGGVRGGGLRNDDRPGGARPIRRTQRAGQRQRASTA